MSGRDFWSRRRAAVAAEAKAQKAALMAADTAEAEAQLEARDDDDILAELGLPQPEALESAEAAREFLNAAVPQRLKTRALRRLWRLNPVLANIDGLVDYGEDFTDGATVIENLQTAYQVGKGMLKHMEALAAQAEHGAREEDQETDLAGPDTTDAPGGDPECLAERDIPLAEEEPVAMEAALASEEVARLPRPRRMTFTFEDQRT